MEKFNCRQGNGERILIAGEKNRERRKSKICPSDKYDLEHDQVSAVS